MSKSKWKVRVVFVWCLKQQYQRIFSYLILHSNGLTKRFFDIEKKHEISMDKRSPGADLQQ